MLLMRSVLAGMFGACFFYLLQLRAPSPPEAREEPQPPESALRVVDVAQGIDSTAMSGLVPLSDGERVTSVDGEAIPASTSAGVAIVSRGPKRGQYLDVTVDGPAGARRVLVLAH